MSKNYKIILSILMILNLVVLMGQLLPEAAPPFARTVNIIFLIMNLILITFLLIKKRNVE